MLDHWIFDQLWSRCEAARQQMIRKKFKMFLSYSLVVLSLFYLGPISSKPLQLVRHPNGGRTLVAPEYLSVVQAARAGKEFFFLFLIFNISRLFSQSYLHIHNRPFTVCYSNYCLGTKGTTQVFQEREVDKGKLQACSSPSSSSTPSSWAGSIIILS